MAIPRTPLLTTDCVMRDNKGRVLLIRRKNEPFKGAYALPGGFVEIGETVEAACRREVLEETGLTVGQLRLLGIYSDPRRDPRGHTVSVVYMAWLPRAPAPKAGSDAEAAEWVESWGAVELAFDHARIVADAENSQPRDEGPDVSGIRIGRARIMSDEDSITPDGDGSRHGLGGPRSMLYLWARRSKRSRLHE
jgi:8-oxo-dGTP diphosphatase